MSRSTCLMLPLIALGLADVSAAHAGVIYDVATDFSAANNPNSPWSYGSSPTLGGAFFLLTHKDQLAADGTSAPLDEWFAVAPAQGPVVVHNGNATSQTFGNGDAFDPGAYIVAPGYPDYVVTRFTTPMAGQYQLSALFEGVDFPYGTTVDVHILLNGSSLFDGTIDGFAGRPYIETPRFGSFPDQSYEALLTLSTGDVIDFVVGDGGNGPASDGTELSARLSAVPEPSSLVLWGFATVGIAIGVAYRRHWVDGTVQPSGGS
jgi:hypothetical protein